MRVVPRMLLVAACCVPVGCNMFGKKSATPTSPAVPTANPRNPAAVADRSGIGPVPDRSAPPANVGGLLAGRVLDSFNGPPPAVAYIQVSEPKESGKSAPAPIEIVTDAQGYFTIVNGLQPGKHYQLVARTRNGERVLAGTTWATAPDPKVLIRVSEDFATPGASGTPANAGGNPASPNQPAPNSGSQTKAVEPASGKGDQAWAPGRASSEIGRGALNNLPDASPYAPPINATPPSETPMVSPHPENVTLDPSRQLANRDAPEVRIPTQGPSVAIATPPSRTQDDGAYTLGPARVPSCALVGQTLTNFALYDLNGQPWEYRRDHRGRLVLIDFWGTWCYYCLQAIPHLKILNQQYANSGLEVVGIAYEDGTPQERVQKVLRVQDRLKINYKVLMGTDRASCPVRVQFGVVNWPTLVLLDEQGRIVWRGEGFDQKQIRELEIIIRQRLGVR